VSALGRKARGDLLQHRARTLLAMLTLTLAVASLAVLAVPGLMDRAMDRQVQADHLYDVAVATHDLVLTPEQLAALKHLPNIAAVDTSIRYPAEVTVGSRRQTAMIWGVDLGAQPVDAIQMLTGRLPRPGEILADAANASAADFPAAIGTRVEIRGSNGTQRPLDVSGTAGDLATSPSPALSDNPVFYTSEATVRSLAGLRGINYLTFRLVSNTPGTEASAIAAVHAYLERLTGTEPFEALPATRSQGDWPARSYFDDTVSLFYFITLLAVCSALFLIASIMNTLIAEQAGEIAILKTLGGRRHQIAGVVLRTAGLLGGAGAILGAGLGIGLAYVLTSFFATSLFDLRAGFAVSIPVVAASLVLGPALAVAASLPGLRRALRRPVAETLADRGVAGYGTGRLERLVARSRLLSGPARMGVRNVLRQKRRSAATIAQVAIATGLALALFASGRSIDIGVNQVYSTFHYAIEVDAGNGSPLLGSKARSAAAATPGVTRVEPVVENSVEYQGTSYAALGLGVDPLYQYRLSAGRWFTAADASAAVPPVVLGPAVARAGGARVGQLLTLDAAAGPTRVKVVGIDTGQSDNGGVVYFPLAVLQRLTGMGDASNALWLTTSSPSHAAIDRATVAVQDRLAAAGYPVSTQEVYVEAADNHATDDTILIVIEVLGLLVVVIALIGLVSALTMGVIERTREIGILRCLGARARHVRRVFSAEGVLLATAGWAVSIPVGWLIYEGLLAFVKHDFGITATVVFPVVSLPVALAAVIAITLVVIRAPLRRATRVQPGGTLRYQ
jgi:putative ABC transport system permease protein